MLKNMLVICLSLVLGSVMVEAGQPTNDQSYKGQFCTDPRTMRKHPAYTEWADAYSCTRHRCQPGGRNLAIYTVGCKRVEAPESAIECEEVVEDTNMQFPFCCTRLRCLVVVRGEVWTRVLGQPWETLPAAPWSHMYKMKKPPPADSSFLPKTEEGPVYELQPPESPDNNSGSGDKVPRANKKSHKKSVEYGDAHAAAAPPPPGPEPTPDIVIALSLSSEKTSTRKAEENSRQKRGRTPSSSFLDEEQPESRPEEVGETQKTKKDEQKPVNEPASDEKYYADSNLYSVTKKPAKQLPTWTEVPSRQWNDPIEPVSVNTAKFAGNEWSENEQRDRPEPEMEALRIPDTQTAKSPAQSWERPQEVRQSEYTPGDDARRVESKNVFKPEGLQASGNQALVDEIGVRMRHIESVVSGMKDKVEKSEDLEQAEPQFTSNDNEEKYHETEKYHEGKEKGRAKKPSPDSEHYKRFSARSRSKYVHGGADTTTDQPLYIEDTHLNGYFSDASNSLVRRKPPKEPPVETYMAPVEANTRRKLTMDLTEDFDKKHNKKRVHKKKKGRAHHKKHHGKEDKKRKLRLNSNELDRTNAVSLEDSNGSTNYNNNNGV